MRYCSVPQCNTYANELGVSFHRYPRSKKMRKIWLIKLKMGKTPENFTHYAVCSKHFCESDFKAVPNGSKRRFLKDSAMPSVNLPQRKFDRASRSFVRKPRNADHQQLVGTGSMDPDAAADPLALSDGLMTDSMSDHTYGSRYQPSDACTPQEQSVEDVECAAWQESDTGYEDTNVPGQHSTSLQTCTTHEYIQGMQVDINQRAGIECISIECPQESPQLEVSTFLEKIVRTADVACQASSLELPRFSPLVSASLLKNEHELVALTCIPCKQLFENIVPIYTEMRKTVSERGFSISDDDAILLTFMKLYHNLTYSALGVIFRIHRTTVAKIFKLSVCILSEILGQATYWPEKEEVLNNITSHFKGYTDTRVVLDCTEVPLQRPKDLNSRILTYSHYKRTYTAKILVGETPGGMISFVSKGYGGKASDSLITDESEVLALCEPYTDAVMADKGFLIDKQCEDARVTLYRPPFLGKKGQLSERAALQNQSIAAARVHVERAIQRMKVFKILREPFDADMLPYFDKVITIIAGIVNLSRPIINATRL
ncbi:uncharacterized protein LOC135369175 isoform X2 [Ornithodoros turicata]|uniref:uncharacterized protein LOC135369175 isoform X2 n=1 Tax=Ornithodoros turicata TaxID=34597 RepID=UPI003139BEDD